MSSEFISTSFRWDLSMSLEGALWCCCVAGCSVTKAALPSLGFRIAETPTLKHVVSARNVISSAKIHIQPRYSADSKHLVPQFTQTDRIWLIYIVVKEHVANFGFEVKASSVSDVKRCSKEFLLLSFSPCFAGSRWATRTMRTITATPKRRFFLPVTRLLCIDYHRFIMIHMLEIWV